MAHITSPQEVKEAIYVGEDIEVENLKVYDDVREILMNMAEFYAETGHWKMFMRCQKQVENLDQKWGDRYNNIVIGSVTRVPALEGG